MAENVARGRTGAMSIKDMLTTRIRRLGALIRSKLPKLPSRDTAPKAIVLGGNITYNIHRESLEKMSPPVPGPAKEFFLNEQIGSSVLPLMTTGAGAKGTVSTEESEGSSLPQPTSSKAKISKKAAAEREGAIESAFLPLKSKDKDLCFEAKEPIPPPPDNNLNIAYLRGLSTSLFYNSDFENAATYLKLVLDKATRHSKTLDARLALLECHLYMGSYQDSRDVDLEQEEGFIEKLEAEAKMIDRMIEWTTDVSISDLLRLAVELAHSYRSFGVIILCRATALRLPITGADKELHFYLTYYLFMEMALRVISVVKVYSRTAEFLLCCMNRVLNKMKLFVKDERSACLESAPDIVMKRKIAYCLNALAYLCNCCGLYEGAGKFSMKGHRYYIGLPKTEYSIVCVDLLVNLAVAQMARGQFGDSRETLDNATEWLDKVIADRKQMKQEKEKKRLDEYKLRKLMMTFILDRLFDLRTVFDP